MDYHGSRLSKDIAYLEPLSRHRNLMGLYDRIPLISSTSFIAQNASLVGEVMVGEGTSIWYGATLRGDHAAIRLGNNTIVGDHSVLKATHSLPTGIPNSITIGQIYF